MSKSGGDFGPINALGIGMMLALLPALMGVGILAYKVGQVIDREIVQQFINICGIGTVAIAAILGLIFLLMVERRRPRDYPPPPPPIGAGWDTIPPQYMAQMEGTPFRNLPPQQAPFIDISPDDRGTVHLAGVDRQLADTYKGDDW